MASTSHRILAFCFIYLMRRYTSVLVHLYLHAYAFSHVQAYLSLRGYRYLRLDGGTSSEERQTRLALYNQENSPYFLFILSTKAGGLARTVTSKALVSSLKPQAQNLRL